MRCLCFDQFSFFLDSGKQITLSLTISLHFLYWIVLDSMGKSKKRNRTKALYEAAAAAKRRMLQAKAGEHATINTFDSTHTIQSPSESSSKEPQNLLLQEEIVPSIPSQPLSGQPSQSDIATTLRTIRYLAKFPDQFLHSKEYKELRGALHPLVTERLKFYDKGIDYRQKVTLHLSHRRWSAALSSLAAAKDFQQIPKQGTVQRWVRDVDICADGPVKIQLLTAILSCKDKNISNNNDGIANSDEQGDGNVVDEAEGERINKHDPALALLEAQNNLKKMNSKNNDDSEDIENGPVDPSKSSELKVLDGWRIPSPPSPPDDKDNEDVSADPLQRLESRIVYQENASERTPPNHYDLMLHATVPFAVLPLQGKKIAMEVSRHEIPFLTGAFCLKNVLSSEECSRLIQAASILGYRPDHPTNLDSPTGIDSCEWLVDDSIHNLIFERVKTHLPLSVGEASTSNKNALCGINKRWRCFRYGQNCVYRPHIDGSWPAGYLSEDGKSYELDKSGSTRSYLTFLIYLNDGFEGGETRFFYPEQAGATSLVARGVVPQKGSVLVFPQGNTASLLHEGSAVTKGTKYVVRTDVLYKHT